jgi:hypothetical protein
MKNVINSAAAVGAGFVTDEWRSGAVPAEYSGTAFAFRVAQ